MSEPAQTCTRRDTAVLWVGLAPKGLVKRHSVWNHRFLKFTQASDICRRAAATTCGGGGRWGGESCALRVGAPPCMGAREEDLPASWLPSLPHVKIEGRRQ